MSHYDAEDKLRAVRSVLSQFAETFEHRPRMLGTPEEVNVMFFFLDRIEFVLARPDPENYWQYSWPAFLSEKGLLKGARDLLKEDLARDGQGFGRLKLVREEYRRWLEVKLSKDAG